MHPAAHALQQLVAVSRGGSGGGSGRRLHVGGAAVGCKVGIFAAGVIKSDTTSLLLLTAAAAAAAAAAAHCCCLLTAAAAAAASLATARCNSEKVLEIFGPKTNL